MCGTFVITNLIRWLFVGLILNPVLGKGAPVDDEWQRPLRLPILDDDVSFRVPVKMFGSVHYFLVDTGASATALDSRYRSRLGDPVEEIQAHTFYRCPELFFDQTPAGLVKIFCVDLRMFELITGEQCDGVLGMDFLNNHVVEMDFERQLFSVGKEVSQDIKETAWGIPLTLTNKRHFTASALLNSRVRLQLMIDSGDSATISLNNADWDRVFAPGNKPPTQKSLIAGLGTNVTDSQVARIQTLEIQSNKYLNLVCLLSPRTNSPSSLGLPFLKRHLVTFDFPNQMLYLRPGKDFRIEEEYDMSGLHLLRQNGNTMVHSVDEGSPAALAGIQAGDLITFINGKEPACMKMKDLRSILKAKAGEKVCIKIKRGHKALKVEFVLRRMV